ncbi:MAG TPA: glycosyltransferase, partial [Gemmatimonadales bacterium]|nr:glycosyltransferase [Gemmatimonadales bacterium]
MAQRARVLFLSQCLPYPPHTGVAARTFNILTQLQRSYDVDLVAFYRITHQPDRRSRDAAWAALRQVVSSAAEPTPIPGEHSRLRRLWDHARSLVTGRVYTFYEYDSAAFAQRLRSVLRARRPDIVHLDSLDLHRWLPALPAVPIVCTHHDIDSDLLRRRSRQLGPAERRYFLLQADRSERLARELCPQFAANVMMSEVDARKLQELAPGAATVVVPNGTDTDYFQPHGCTSIAPGGAGERVAFVGPTLSSYPNRDAVEFLLEEIWPRIRAVGGSTSLQL